jgi:hypothetical protein
MRALLLAAACAGALACTQDFDQFRVTAGVGAQGATGATGGQGGTAGSGGDDCPVDPQPPGGACPEECDRCDGDTCVFECDAINECLSRNMVCPDGFACLVECEANASCALAQVTCPAEEACALDCARNNACPNLSMACGDGSCTGTCGATNSCVGVDVTCGTGACSAACAEAAVGPALACGDACSCVDCP